MNMKTKTITKTCRISHRVIINIISCPLCHSVSVTLFCFIYHSDVSRNMRETLEEVHRATMMNPRAAAEYAPLVHPGDPATGRPPQKLCVFVWDSWQVKIQKPGNHKNQRGTYSTKIKGNSLQRMEGVDLEGKPVFALCPSASISPRATDESISFFTLQNEAVTGARGGFTDMLVGLPEYCMVHLWDNGYRYWCILKIVYGFIFLLHSIIR